MRVSASGGDYAQLSRNAFRGVRGIVTPLTRLPRQDIIRRSPIILCGRTMPLHHHGGTPHTKRQQHAKSGKDAAVLANSAGIEREIHTEPFNHGRWEQAVHTHSAGHAPAPTTGRSTSVSIQENAAIIRSVAENQSPSGGVQLASSSLEAMAPTPFNTDAIGALQEASQRQEELTQQAVLAAGEATTDAQTINGAGANAVQAINTAVQAAMNAQALLEQYTQALQAAKGATDDATAACEQFRQTCSDVAARHGA